jgi:hypothetical protein
MAMMHLTLPCLGFWSSMGLFIQHFGCAKHIGTSKALYVIAIVSFGGHSSCDSKVDDFDVIVFIDDDILYSNK